MPATRIDRQEIDLLDVEGDLPRPTAVELLEDQKELALALADIPVWSLLSAVPDTARFRVMSSQATIRDGILYMDQDPGGSVVITEKGIPTAMLTERDLLNFGRQNAEQLEYTKISSLRPDREIVTAHIDDSLGNLIVRMHPELEYSMRNDNHGPFFDPPAGAEIGFRQIPILNSKGTIVAVVKQEHIAKVLCDILDERASAYFGSDKNNVDEHRIYSAAKVVFAEKAIETGMYMPVCIAQGTTVNEAIDRLIENRRAIVYLTSNSKTQIENRDFGQVIGTFSEFDVKSKIFMPIATGLANPEIFNLPVDEFVKRKGLQYVTADASQAEVLRHLGHGLRHVFMVDQNEEIIRSCPLRRILARFSEWDRSAAIEFKHGGGSWAQDGG